MKHGQVFLRPSFRHTAARMLLNDRFMFSWYGFAMNVPVKQQGHRSWWRMKRWWILIAAAVDAAFLRVHFFELRADAMRQLRADMQHRALNGPEIEPTPPCETANDGTQICPKPNVFVACETRVFIDPLEVWARTGRRYSPRTLVKDKYDELGDMQKLAQWFACQGFQVTHGHGIMNAGVRTPNGYGLFNHSTFPWPPQWSDHFDTGGRKDADGRLGMEIGITYL